MIVIQIITIIAWVLVIWIYDLRIRNIYRELDELKNKIERELDELKNETEILKNK